MHEVDPRQILNNPNSSATDRVAAWQQLKKPELQQGIAEEAKELLKASGKHHLSEITDAEFLTFVRNHGFEAGSADYDRLRDELRDYRAPSEAYLRAEFLAHDGDPTRWAELRYWLSRWCRHFKTWLVTSPATDGTPPLRSHAFRFADSRLHELLRDPETLPWMRQSVEVYIALTMNPDPDQKAELWRPDPGGSGNYVSETELLWHTFPASDGGSLALYRWMEKIREVFQAGIWEYPGGDTAMHDYFTKAKDKLAPR